MSNTLTNVQKGLRDFKLAGILRTLEDKIDYANSKQLSYLEFMETLIESEICSRKNNSLKKRLSKSKISQAKNIEDYDFKFQPTLNKSEIIELSCCSFIDKRENIFFGKPGTGKTHLSCAIGIKALYKGYEVVMTTAHDLIENLFKSKADGTHTARIHYYVQPHLLIIDELGFKKFTQTGADDLFEIINRRYEKKSTIITSNKSFEDWGQVFFDPVLASAMVDRFIHHCHVITIKGNSYRSRHYKEPKKEPCSTLQASQDHL